MLVRVSKVRLLAVLFMVALAIAPFSVAQSQTLDAALEELVSGRLERLVREEPAEAVAEIDRLLPGSASDPRTAFDLVALKTEAQEALGDTAGQAAGLRDLAILAIRYRDTLDRDPVPYLEEAAALFESLGDLRTSIGLAREIVDQVSAAGASREVIAEAFDRVARLERANGNDFAASQAEFQAQSFRNLTASSTDPTRNADDGFEVVEVFYATDRARSGDPDPSRFYGYARGELDYGKLEVTIPKSHRAGALETPSIWRLEFSPNPAKHVVLRSVVPVEKVQFFEDMSTRVQSSGQAEAIVFVHGYNVTFEAAAKRSAQLAYDIGFEGVPILYSWPSRGATSGYIADSAVVRLSGRRLSQFLEDVVALSGATTVHLVAHSMGNRAMTDALELLALRRGEAAEPAFGQVVFAAPDLDAGLFSAMMPTIRPIARRITLYGSEADWALVASRKLHGDAPRAGQAGEDALALAEVDTVDMSELGEDMLAHSYVSNDSSVLLDMVSLFWKNVPPERRCGLAPARKVGSITIWKYVPGSCDDNTLIALMANFRHDGATDPNQVAATMSRAFGGAPPDKVAEVVQRLLEP